MTKSELRQIIREEISKVSKENISSFLTANKQELLSKLAKKFQSYRGEENKANKYKITPDSSDTEVAILTQSGMSVGLDFSFNPLIANLWKPNLKLENVFNSSVFIFY